MLQVDRDLPDLLNRMVVILFRSKYDEDLFRTTQEEQSLSEFLMGLRVQSSQLLSGLLFKMPAIHLCHAFMKQWSTRGKS